MKIINLMSFFYKDNYYYQNKDSLNDVINSLNLNIDYLIKLGWQASDLIIKTNFSFSYKNISSIPFENQYSTNLFLTKIIAAYEVLKQHPDAILWQHDHDTYQIKEFNEEDLRKHITNDINLCNYWPGNNRPQGASIFYKYFSSTIKDMYNIIISTNIDLCDEKFLMHFMSNYCHDISLNLPYQYNTSITRLSHNKRYAENPYCVHGDIRHRFTRKLLNQYLK